MINLNQTTSNSSNCDLISTIQSQLTEMPSIEASMINHPKHLCIRLATGPQYYS
jgi:hypothetical protein